MTYELRFEISLSTYRTAPRSDRIFLHLPFLQLTNQFASMFLAYLYRKRASFFLALVHGLHISNNKVGREQIPYLRWRRMLGRMYILVFSRISSIFGHSRGLKGSGRDLRLICCACSLPFSTPNVLLSRLSFRNRAKFAPVAYQECSGDLQVYCRLLLVR